MATNKAQFEVGAQYSVKGQLATHVESAKGWHSFETEDGETLKVRAKDVKAAGVAAGKSKASGQRVFRVIDPETGDEARVATFKMDRYTRHKDASTEGGHRPIDINDETAANLRGLGVEDQYEEAARLIRSFRDEKWPGTKAEIEKELRKRYSHLNQGQIRMNLGNVVRGCINRAAREEELAEAAS